MKNKIVVFAGTRPEAIKLAPVVLELKKATDTFETVVCATGQHGEMLYQALADFDIVPDFDLKVMKVGQSLASLTQRLICGIDAILEDQKPDWVLVQGDTTTVMAGAMCSFYRKMKIGHVEAGLRTYNRWSPFPEEINRRVASLVADIHFSPTEQAKQNLLDEGIGESNIVVTGNTVIDALMWMRERNYNEEPKIPPSLINALSNGRRLVLVTGHRRESFGPDFEEICQAIRTLAEVHRDTYFVYPVHFNPNVRHSVMSILKGVERVILTDPLSYRVFVWLMERCSLILTDSGGIQEEAPTMGKSVIIMRDITERPEGVIVGTSRLVGTQRTRIVETVTSILNNSNGTQSADKVNNPYGDGLAAQRIVHELRTQTILYRDDHPSNLRIN